MKLYHYDNEGIYIGELEARQNPRTGEALIPANVTELAPPVTGENQVATFKESAWKIEDDFRGVKYWDADGKEHTIEEIGETIPNGALMEAPPQSLEESQSQALSQIENDYATALLASVGNPTEAERDTWPIKRECALAYQAGVATEAQQTSLTRYAEARGQSGTDYVALVLAAADQHEQAAAYFEGIKTSAKADIIAAATIEEIENILSSLDWSYPREIKS